MKEQGVLEAPKGGEALTAQTEEKAAQLDQTHFDDFTMNMAEIETLCRAIRQQIQGNPGLNDADLLVEIIEEKCKEMDRHIDMILDMLCPGENLEPRSEAHY